MTKIEKKIRENYTSIYSFAIENKISPQLAEYYAKTNSETMQIRTLIRVSNMLNCEYKELI